MDADISLYAVGDAAFAAPSTLVRCRAGCPRCLSAAASGGNGCFVATP